MPLIHTFIALPWECFMGLCLKEKQPSLTEHAPDILGQQLPEFLALVGDDGGKHQFFLLLKFAT